MSECHFPDLVGCIVIMKEKVPVCRKYALKYLGVVGVLDWQLTLK